MSRPGKEAYGKKHGDSIRALRDIHKGERCFVLGNGPSLGQVDATMLAGEYTLATNLFIKTEAAKTFSPTYYCMSDDTHWQKGRGFVPSLLEALPRLTQTTFFLESEAEAVVNATPEFAGLDIRYLYLEYENTSVLEHGVHSRVHEFVRWGRTVIADFCLPLARYMGFNEIYLLGCDYNWTDKPVTQDSFSSIKYAYDPAEDDRHLFCIKEYRTMHHNGNMIETLVANVHAVADDFSKQGCTVYNAGHGGNLTQLPTVEFDSLFPQGRRSA